MAKKWVMTANKWVICGVLYLLISGCVAIQPMVGDYVRIKDWNEFESFRVTGVDGRWVYTVDCMGEEWVFTKYEVKEVIK